MQQSTIGKIKQKVRIAEVAQELIPGLKSANGRLVGTVRGEKTPALTIYPKSESWYHFAGDVTPKGHSGGDVINLVEFIKQCTTKEAIAWLADRYHIPLQPLTPQEEQDIKEARLCQEVLTQAAKIYNNHLLNDLQAKAQLDYLQGRGFFS